MTILVLLSAIIFILCISVLLLIKDITTAGDVKKKLHHHLKWIIPYLITNVVYILLIISMNSEYDLIHVFKTMSIEYGLMLISLNAIAMCMALFICLYVGVRLITNIIMIPEEQ